MSVIGSNALAGASGQGSGGGYVIEKSLRFTPGDTAYLSRSATDSGDVYKYTVSWWMKIGGLGTDRTIISFATNNAVDGWTKIHLRTNNRLAIFGDSSGTALSIRPSMQFRDPNAWYHCVVALDTTQSAYSDQAKFWINGVQQTDFDGTTAFATNTALSIGKATTHHVGVEPDSVGSLRNYFNGYIANLQVVEGQALDETTFGEFDNNNVWKPKKVDSTLLQPVVNAGTGAQSLYNLGSDLSTKASPATFRTDSNASNLQIAVAGDNSDEVSHSIRGSGSALALTTSNVTFNQTGKFYSDAFLIQGSGAHCSVAETAAAKPGTSDFCVEFWINPTVTPNNSGLFSYGDYNSAGSFGIMTTGSNSLRVDMHDGYSQTGSALSVTGGLQTGWQHFALTRSGTTCTLYKNGTSQGTWTINASADFTPASNPYFVIGNRLGLPFSSYNITSYFQDFRVYVGTSKYTGNFTVPSQTGSNSFHLDFADGSNIGNDAAGSNNWNATNLTGVAASVSVSDVTIQSGGSIISGGDPGNWFDGNKDTYAYANLSDSTNYIQWAPSGGYTTPGYIWIQGGDGNGDGLDVMTVTINGSTVSHSSVVSNETYSQAAYDWGKWYKYAVSGNTLNSVRVTGAFTLLRQISTVADPTHSVLGISDDNDVPVLIAGSPADLDLLFDSPTNGDATADTGAGGEVSGNYCTGNPLHPNMSASVVTLSEGNLKGEISSGSGWHTAPCTIGVSSGKWYFEQTIHNSYAMVGIAAVDAVFAINGHHTGTHATGVGYFNANGDRYTNNTATSYGASYGDGDVIGCAFDMDARSVTFYKNGVSQGEITSIITANKTYAPVFSLNGQDGAGSYSWNFGQRAFAYTAPSGFKALCTTNLPTPDVPDGSAYFDAKLYDGNGSTNAITGLEFSPDLVWLKSRGQAKSHCLFDTVRGVNNRILSNTTDEEYTVANTLTSFDNNGFTLGSNNEANNSGYSHVAWAWDAGDSNTSISAGSLNSSVYDQSQTWSTYGTFDNNWSNSAYHWDDVFNTTLANNGDGSLYVDGTTKDTWNLSSSYAVSNTIKVYVQNPTEITINEGLSSETVVTSDGGTSLHYYEFSFTGNVESVGVRHASGGGIYLMGIWFDGKQLVDDTETPANVPGIASTVRVNQSAGFSIVSYTGSSTNTTVGHGLNAAPEMIIVKDRDYSYNWQVNHIGIGADESLILNGNNVATDYNAWNNTRPTSSVFSLGAGTLGVNSNGNNLIAYCFAPVEGYSKFGTYEGNQNASNGAVIWTGFAPAFILVKYVDSQGQWYIYDYLRSPYNVAYQVLTASQTDIENTSSTNFNIDILSSGFKLRQSNGPNNNGTYIWAAFAKNPFQANGGIAR